MILYIYFKQFMSVCFLFSVVSTSCPPNLSHTSIIESFKGKCYQFVSEEMYWPQARNYCSKNNGNLVQILDKDINDFIVTTLNKMWWRNNGVWIGLNDLDTELNWTWDTGAEDHHVPLVGFANWGKGHPEAILHDYRDCVRMLRSEGRWEWHEAPCQTLKWQYRFICEYDSVEAITAKLLYNELNKTKIIAYGAFDNYNRTVINYADKKEAPIFDEFYDVNVPIVQAPLLSQEHTMPEFSKRNSIILAIGLMACITTIVLILILFIRRRSKQGKLLGISTLAFPFTKYKFDTSKLGSDGEIIREVNGELNYRNFWINRNQRATNIYVDEKFQKQNAVLPQIVATDYLEPNGIMYDQPRLANHYDVIPDDGPLLENDPYGQLPVLYSQFRNTMVGHENDPIECSIYVKENHIYESLTNLNA